MSISLLLTYGIFLLSLTLYAADVTYPIVSTGQAKCYDTKREISPPSLGQTYYGQDAQFSGTSANYTLSTDGLTVKDNITGLTWQSSPTLTGNAPKSSDKLGASQFQVRIKQLNEIRYGGFDDWRLPTIKELYSLILFSGIDISSPSMTELGQTPFIDKNFFKFSYGDPSANERPIDSQWATCTTYVANPQQMFGVNFADGRIKGYGTVFPGRGEKTFFVLCVRGNPLYGKNDFLDNQNGTITDRATGLMWSKDDSGKGMNWKSALAWVQQKNAEKYLGYSDWRLPNIKELQSIVDYSRSPNTTQSAAIDPVFNATSIANEIGQTDWPYFWSSTTHVGLRGGEDANYISFGRASGWMPARGFGGAPSGRNAPPEGSPETQGSNSRYEDVHGAGAQRSDPKHGDLVRFSRGRGPQGDIVRIENFVRLVRATSEVK